MPSQLELKHLSNWFAGSASWQTAFLEKCVLHGQTVEQTALNSGRLFGFVDAKLPIVEVLSLLKTLKREQNLLQIRTIPT